MSSTSNGLPRQRAILLLLASGLATELRPHAQSYRLTGPVPPRPGGGDVQELLVTPDGTRVVYRANEEDYVVFELFSAPVDGSAPPVKLNGFLEEYEDVAEHRFGLTPDGARAVYLAGQGSSLDLHSAPVDGSASAVQLSGPMHGDGVVSFQISADGSRVAYAADQTTWHRFELYSAPVDGSASWVLLSGDLPAFASLADFRVDAEGRAVYLADAAVDGRFDLFSVPVDGSADPVQLTHLPASNQVTEFQLAPCGGWAYFVQRQTSPSTDAWLLGVRLDGSAAPFLLTPTPLAEIAGLRVDPTGSRALYRAAAVVSGAFELYSVPVDGSRGPPVRLNRPLPAGRSVEDGYDVTADGARVLYLADQTADDLFELWSAPIDGSAAALELSGPLVAGGDVACVAGVSRVSAGERVVYVADQDTDGLTELYSVPADGSAAAVKLNGPLFSAAVQPYSSDPRVPALPFGTDPTRAVFALDVVAGVETLTELYSVLVDASASPVRLSGPPVPGGSVLASRGWGFAGERVVYVADQDTDEVGELYSTPLDGGPGFVTLNGPMAPTPPGSSVDHDFELTGGTVRAVYQTQGSGGWQLGSVLADGSGFPVVLAPSLPSAVYFEVTPDGARVAYWWSVFGIGSHLYSVLADGSASPLLLASGPRFSSPRLTPDGVFALQVTEDGRILRAELDGGSPPLYLTDAPSAASRASVGYQVSPLGDRVVFRQDRDVLDRFELFSVPLDGSSPPVKLNPPLPATGDVSGYAISPDGLQVVYGADLEFDHRDYLYAVSILGGAAHPLSGPMASGGGVEAFEIAPQGGRVAYVADQEVNQRFELFSVPLAGGAAVKLNGPLPAGASIGSWPYEDDFGFSPDGARVVYLADQEVYGRSELFSVPGAGGVAVKLNRTLAAGERIVGHLVSPDSRFVVFDAGNYPEGPFEVFCRRIDGSGRPWKLNGPLPPGGSASFRAITPDGRQLVYSADQREDDVLELFAVPIRGGEPRRLNGPLVPRGDVSRCLISHDSRTVVYLADQDTNTVYELYGSSLRTRTRTAPAPPSDPPDRAPGSRSLGQRGPGQTGAGIRAPGRGGTRASSRPRAEARCPQGAVHLRTRAGPGRRAADG